MAKAMLDGALMFPSDYVCATELKGKDVAVTIAGVKREELMIEGGVKKPGVIVWFKESPKKLVLNKTNSNTVAGLHGSEAKQWVGKRVTLYPTTCKCKGKTVDCIRIRDTHPTGKAPAPEQDTGRPIERGESVTEADID